MTGEPGEPEGGPRRPGTGIGEPGVVEDGTVPPRCVSLDLEVGKEDGRIRALAGVRADTGRSFAFGGGDLTAALAGLDDLADGASFVLGHNLKVVGSNPAPATIASP